MDIPFQPVRYMEGYLPIRDHALIGDGNTAALVGRDGAIDWLCLPRFDCEPLFCRILDARRGGEFLVAPDDLIESRQYYLEDSAVLVTEMRTPTGMVRLTDSMSLLPGARLEEDEAAHRKELVRIAEVVQGNVRLLVSVAPRGGAVAERRSGGIHVRCERQPNLDLQLFSSLSMSGLNTSIEMQQGERLELILRWGRTAYRVQSLDAAKHLEETTAAWKHWLHAFDYAGPQRDLVRRSALTIKLLNHMENGAIVAAPTSSLPELIGGTRNWDYRYTWIRDAAFSVYALRRIGLVREAWSFLGWAMDAVEHNGKTNVLYTLDGTAPPPETYDDELEGYRRSAPVRWGNAAAAQTQHDVYGEILDCAYQWAAHGGEMDCSLWEQLLVLVEAARRNWRKPDHGIWEVRTLARPFTYSAALCQVALDRAARIAERFSLPGDVEGWRSDAQLIQAAILDEAWDPKLGALVEHLGEGELDASVLALPLRRVVDACHPRMVATTQAIADRLGTGNGLLYRYLPAVSPDGLPGHEGAFLLCSFWMVDNLANQGRLDEAMDLYDRLCARAGHLGLLPEEIDPATGAFLGNFPQALSHIGLISSGVNLAILTGSPAGNPDAPQTEPSSR